MSPTAHDLYVVIEDIAYGSVLFNIARWPQMDEKGRLAFDPKGRSQLSVPHPLARDFCNAGRSRLSQLGRPLRVSDVFQMRGDASDFHSWKLICDVTAPAREAAKLALHAATAPCLTPAEEDRVKSGPVQSDSAEPGLTGPSGASPAI